MAADAADRDVVAKVFELTAEGRQKDLPKYMHPDLKVRAFLPPNPVLDLPALKRNIKERSHDRIREARAHSIERVGDKRYVATGRVRWSDPGGGFTDVPAAWAIEVKDGLIYRLFGTSNVDIAIESFESDDWGPSAPLTSEPS
jgi:hypothetical protein